MACKSFSPAAYDLHLHTCWSYDATVEPELYFKRAKELGIRCIAVVEHHNIDSFEEIAEISEHYPEVRVIFAAELTVETSIGAVDLLCYNIPFKLSGALLRVMREYRGWQRKAGSSVSAGMRALGFSYDDAERMDVLRSYRPERALKLQGATHVANNIQRKHFLQKGYIKRQGDYEKIMGQAREAGKRPEYPSVKCVAPAVKEAGGLVVIAHPSGYFGGKNTERMDLLRGECLLDGIECAHRQVSPELTDFYRHYCLEYDLVSTGGSDCHHKNDVISVPGTWGYTENRQFACHIGRDAWLDEFLERIG